MSTLYFDITKSRKQAHASGLNRVSGSLLRELRKQTTVICRPVFWSTIRRSYLDAETQQAIGCGGEGDAFFTPEIFALRERPFCRRWLKQFKGTTGVLFYDAIPYFRSETTWPRSVRRFPHWFKDLQSYDRVLFISGEARQDAAKVHQHTGWPPVDGPILPLGCDYAEAGPLPRLPKQDPSVLLNIGIIEPRKGQALLLEACESLWAEGHTFKLVLLGRVNPHFGRDIAATIHRLQANGRALVHEAGAGDDRLAYWHQRASLVVLPSFAEGFGLPVLEALWAGCPVLCSDQPSVRVAGNGEGITILQELDQGTLGESISESLSNLESAGSEVISPPSYDLPGWTDSARSLIQELDGSSS